MIALTLVEVAAATRGTLLLDGTAATPESVVDGLSTTDSREVVPGTIFFAKPGEVTDGHLFAPQAVDAGASLLVVDHALDLPVPQLLVADTVVALGDLATEVIARVRALGRLKIVGVTGSNGKTTTKNLLRAILEQLGPTIAPRASFNNEVGAPVTMLEVTEETQYLVAEMGASGIGEIARLVRMARPDIGIVLKVGLAHAGEFGGIEKTLAAKTEMVGDLLESDVAVLNLDDPRVASMADKTAARVLWFGLDDRAAVRATDVRSTARGTAFTLHLPPADGGEGAGESRPVQFRVLGEHHVHERPGGGCRCAHPRRRHRRDRRCARERSSAPSAGVWRCSAAPVVSSSSTTRTTRAPTPWPRHSRRWRRSPSRGSALSPSSAR